MSTFEERLAAAKAAPRKYKDVPVCIDEELAQEREKLLEALKEAQKQDKNDERLGAPNDAFSAPIRERLDALAEAAQNALVILRFRRMDGDKWAEITSKHPARVEVPIDMHYGYNYDAACGAAAVYSGVRLEGDEEIPMTPVQWADLFTVIAGSDATQVRDAIWALNEFEPGKRLDALVKGYGAAQRSETN